MPKRRGQCDPRPLSVGESYFTNQGILRWTIQGFTDQSAGFHPNSQYTTDVLGPGCVLERIVVEVVQEPWYSDFEMDVVCRTKWRDMRLSTAKTNAEIEKNRGKVARSGTQAPGGVIDLLYVPSLAASFDVSKLTPPGLVCLEGNGTCVAASPILQRNGTGRRNLTLFL